jgi:hypothetical protein
MTIGPDDPVVDEELVSIRVPVDVADDLTVATVWLSLHLRHRVPIAQLRRVLVIEGVAHVGRALAQLRREE